MCAAGAAAAFGGDSQRILQLLDAARAVLGGVTDGAISDSTADTNVHKDSPLDGNYRQHSVLAGAGLALARCQC